MYLGISAASALVGTGAACGGRTGAENLVKLQFGKWLVSLPDQRDHAIPLPIMTGWLTRLLELCDGLCGWFCGRWPPSHLVIFLKGNLLRISSGLEVMLDFFCFTEFGVLELSKDDCWFHLLRCAWFLLGSLEFSFLVNWLGSNLPCLLFLIFDLARSCRSCFRFYSIFSCVFVSCGRRAVSFLIFFLADAFPFLFLLCTVFFVSCGRLSVYFLVLYRLILFDGTWCRMFVCFQLK